MSFRILSLDYSQPGYYPTRGQIMALLDGKTPEQIAAEIIEAAQKTEVIEISGTANQMLDKLLRYKYAQKIYAEGEKWFEENRDSKATEWLEALIKSYYDQRVKADTKKAQDDQLEYVKVLVSRGVNKFKAMEMAGMLSTADVEAQQKIDAANAAKAEALKKQAEAELQATAKAAAEKVAKK
jgi:hypothetical protein